MCESTSLTVSQRCGTDGGKNTCTTPGWLHHLLQDPLLGTQHGMIGSFIPGNTAAARVGGLDPICLQTISVFCLVDVSSAIQ
jgi:hypothetical protein